MLSLENAVERPPAEDLSAGESSQVPISQDQAGAKGFGRLSEVCRSVPPEKAWAVKGQHFSLELQGIFCWLVQESLEIYLPSFS